jgi:hypothetical protein
MILKFFSFKIFELKKEIPGQFEMSQKNLSLFELTSSFLFNNFQFLILWGFFNFIFLIFFLFQKCYRRLPLLEESALGSFLLNTFYKIYEGSSLIIFLSFFI